MKRKWIVALVFLAVAAAAVIAVIMIIKHRANIVRLIHGEEPKLSFLDKDKKQKEEDNV